MNWNKLSGGLVVALLVGCAVFAIVLSAIPPVQSSISGAASEATLVIEVSSGRHGSVWKFVDGNRQCYFNSSGGMWCTN